MRKDPGAYDPQAEFAAAINPESEWNLDAIDESPVAFEIQKQLLKYAVQKAIFCPLGACGRILDVASSSLIETGDGSALVLCTGHLEALDADDKPIRDTIVLEAARAGHDITITNRAGAVTYRAQHVVDNA